MELSEVSLCGHGYFSEFCATWRKVFSVWCESQTQGLFTIEQVREMGGEPPSQREMLTHGCLLRNGAGGTPCCIFSLVENSCFVKQTCRTRRLGGTSWPADPSGGHREEGLQVLGSLLGNT